MKEIKNFEDVLICPACYQKVHLINGKAKCSSCIREYEFRNSSLHLSINNEHPVQVDSQEHYNHYYSSYQTFSDYWFAADLIMSLQPRDICEIGVGQNILSLYLKQVGQKVLTIDFDGNLNPDIVADIRNMPIENDSIDVLSAFEVLEHLPYEHFLTTVRHCLAKSKKAFVFSIPDVKYVFSFNMIFEIGTRNVVNKHFQLAFPRLFTRKMPKSNQHYWEIGRTGFSLKRIINDLRTITEVKKIEHFRSKSTNSVRFFKISK